MLILCTLIDFARHDESVARQAAAGKGELTCSPRAVADTVRRT